jgi:ABC-type phosphate transport system ATPase subunit
MIEGSIESIGVGVYGNRVLALSRLEIGPVGSGKTNLLWALNLFQVPTGWSTGRKVFAL